MELTDYMVEGGEYLGKPVKTCGFDEESERLFRRWYSVLNDKVSESFTFLDLPLKQGARLFIRALYDEESGTRPVVWWFAAILRPEHYKVRGGVAALHRCLLDIYPPSARLKALRNQSIECSLGENVGSGISERCSEFELNTYRFGSSYRADYEAFCERICKTSIESWFGRLFLAINPKKRYEDFTSVFSLESIPVIERKKEEKLMENSESVRGFTRRKKNTRSKHVILATLVLGIGVFCFFGKSDVEQKIEDIQKEVTELNDNLIETSERFSQTSIQAKRLYDQVESLRKEVLVLKKKNAELQERLYELTSLLEKKDAE